VILRLVGFFLFIAVCVCPVSADAGNCYAEYSAPNGRKMYVLNVGRENIEECRKLNWIPFRATFFASCPTCKLDREAFLDGLNELLTLVAAGKSMGWPYEMQGNLRQWYRNLSRNDALKICRDNAGSWLTLLGSKRACVE
jgi:hypothetical protein